MSLQQNLGQVLEELWQLALTVASLKHIAGRIEQELKALRHTEGYLESERGLQDPDDEETEGRNHTNDKYDEITIDETITDESPFHSSTSISHTAINDTNNANVETSSTSHFLLVMDQGDVEDTRSISSMLAHQLMNIPEREDDLVMALPLDEAESQMFSMNSHQVPSSDNLTEESSMVCHHEEVVPEDKYYSQSQCSSLAHQCSPRKEETSSNASLASIQEIQCKEIGLLTHQLNCGTMDQSPTSTSQIASESGSESEFSSMVTHQLKHVGDKDKSIELESDTKKEVEDEEDIAPVSMVAHQEEWRDVVAFMDEPFVSIGAHTAHPVEEIETRDQTSMVTHKLCEEGEKDKAKTIKDKHVSSLSTPHDRNALKALDQISMLGHVVQPKNIGQDVKLSDDVDALNLSHSTSSHQPSMQCICIMENNFVDNISMVTHGLDISEEKTTLPTSMVSHQPLALNEGSGTLRHLDQTSEDELVTEGDSTPISMLSNQLESPALVLESSESQIRRATNYKISISEDECSGQISMLNHRNIGANYPDTEYLVDTLSVDIGDLDKKVSIASHKVMNCAISKEIPNGTSMTSHHIISNSMCKSDMVANQSLVECEQLTNLPYSTANEGIFSTVEEESASMISHQQGVTEAIKDLTFTLTTMVAHCKQSFNEEEEGAKDDIIEEEIVLPEDLCEAAITCSNDPSLTSPSLPPLEHNISESISLVANSSQSQFNTIDMPEAIKSSLLSQQTSTVEDECEAEIVSVHQTMPGSIPAPGHNISETVSNVAKNPQSQDNAINSPQVITSSLLSHQISVAIEQSEQSRVDDCIGEGNKGIKSEDPTPSLISHFIINNVNQETTTPQINDVPDVDILPSSASHQILPPLPVTKENEPKEITSLVTHSSPNPELHSDIQTDQEAWSLDARLDDILKEEKVSGDQKETFFPSSVCHQVPPTLPPLDLDSKDILSLVSHCLHIPEGLNNTNETTENKCALNKEGDFEVRSLHENQLPIKDVEEGHEKDLGIDYDKLTDPRETSAESMPIDSSPYLSSYEEIIQESCPEDSFEASKEATSEGMADEYKSTIQRIHELQKLVGEEIGQFETSRKDIETSPIITTVMSNVKGVSFPLEICINQQEPEKVSKIIINDIEENVEEEAIEEVVSVSPLRESHPPTLKSSYESVACDSGFEGSPAIQLKTDEKENIKSNEFNDPNLSLIPMRRNTEDTKTRDKELLESFLKNENHQRDKLVEHASSKKSDIPNAPGIPLPSVPDTAGAKKKKNKQPKLTRTTIKESLRKQTYKIKFHVNLKSNDAANKQTAKPSVLQCFLKFFKLDKFLNRK